ncbi:hypothetical protein Tco_1325390 [Tanacetum coccineum]
MTVYAHPAMSLIHLARVAEVMTFLDSAFRKRYRSSYETPSPSLTLPVQKRHRGTSELILDTDSEGDELGDEDTNEDEEDENGTENQKGKGPDWMFDLELLTPSMNYIPVRKENYADSGGQETACNDVEDFDEQQFIVHGPSINAVPNKHSEEHTADKEVPLSSDEQALHDELVSLMHQESLAKLHNDAQRNAFEKEKKRIALEKGKECVDSTFTLSTANTPPQSTGNTPTDSDDDIPKDGVFSTNSFDDENTDTEEGGAADYNNMDPTIDVTSTPTLRIHKIHPQSQIIGKSTAGILTRRKLKESASDQHQASDWH